MLKELFIPDKKNGYYPYAIRKPALSFYTVLLILFNLFSGVLLPAANQEVAASSITPYALIELTNKERVGRGLNSLNTDSRLTEAAYDKAADMFKKDYWDHFGPNGETPWQFINGEGYVYVYAGENLAKGFSTAEGVHQAWMASPTHKANIVNSNYKDIGIAVAEGELQGQKTTLVVQMFGSESISTDSGTSEPSAAAQGSNQKVQDTNDKETPTTEEGEIKSISITAPAAGATVSNPLTSIEGQVDYSKQTTGSYKVKILNGDAEIAAIESSKTTWVYTPENDWEEGKHKITASVEQGRTIPQDSVTFSIDTTPPDFTADDLIVYLNPELDEWAVKLHPSETVSAQLVAGGEKFDLVSVSKAQYLEAAIPHDVLSNANKISLVLTDQVGNKRTENILGAFTSSEVTDTVEKVSSNSLLLSTFRSLSTKNQVNVLFGFFLTLLLGVQIYYYKRHGVLSDHGGYLVTVGFMVIIILVATINGSLGSIV
ncbi:hypothetical protein H6764_03610 [Candidatus Nomurabacteria bacterium]|nr:hypothetical protein [Candidatus Nomurabacteria bacterium]